VVLWRLKDFIDPFKTERKEFLVGVEEVASETVRKYVKFALRMFRENAGENFLMRMYCAKLFETKVGRIMTFFNTLKNLPEIEDMNKKFKYSTC
jgi:hypothetical protein